VSGTGERFSSGSRSLKNCSARRAQRRGFVIIGFFVMPFLRRHSNGFQVVIDRQSTAHGYLWVVYSLVEDDLVGLTASSLNEARGIADSLAIVSHVEECDDACNDWELLKRGNHG